jgi:LDH2 family malate/lactate/ureidoglycolate dehydrogenase
MQTEKYKAQDLIDFGQRVLEQVGFPAKQARAAAMVLVEGDLRGDFAHGIAGAVSLIDFITKLGDDEQALGFKRIQVAEYTVDQAKYPTIISVDAHGALGHYVALEVVPMVIERAKEMGYAKAFIRNSTHFGDCGIYTEMIGQHDLAAKVSCTAPAWSKPFIELQDDPDPGSPVNLERYAGVKKRFGTNPLAWTIPYEGGMITMDMAPTQRAVSPILEVARHNATVLGIVPDGAGDFLVETGAGQRKVSELHLEVAASPTRAEALAKLGLGEDTPLRSTEKGLLKGPGDVDLSFPLVFDSVMKRECYVAQLGGTYFGYKGFGLNMLVELDNVLGGGVSGFIRKLTPDGQPGTPERVAQTIEAYAIDVVDPLPVAKRRLRESVELTLACGNDLMHLPGHKEQQARQEHLQNGVPMTQGRMAMLKKIAADPRVNLPFDLKPV